LLFITRKRIGDQQEEERRKKPKPEEHKGMPLLQSVAKLGTQCSMKSSRKTWHAFSPHIPPKTSKKNISGSTDEMLHTDIITVKTQSTRVCGAYAREATTFHQNSKAINQTTGANWPPFPIAKGW
jgi:hypothetical protein